MWPENVEETGDSLGSVPHLAPRFSPWMPGVRIADSLKSTLIGPVRVSVPSGQMVEIRQADPSHDLDAVKTLWLEYLSWGNDELQRRFGFRLQIQDAVAHDLDTVAKFQPPDGRLLLAVEDDVAVGVVCLRRMGPATAEIKRMYVRPAHRGRGLGRALLDQLIAEALGYRRIRLDSPTFMQAAHGLYRSSGFVDIDPYPKSEIPDEYKAFWVFMERALDAIILEARFT